MKDQAEKEEAREPSGPPVRSHAGRTHLDGPSPGPQESACMTYRVTLANIMTLRDTGNEILRFESNSVYDGIYVGELTRSPIYNQGPRGKIHVINRACTWIHLPENNVCSDMDSRRRTSGSLVISQWTDTGVMLGAMASSAFLSSRFVRVGDQLTRLRTCSLSWEFRLTRWLLTATKVSHHQYHRRDPTRTSGLSIRICQGPCRAIAT